MSSQSQWGDDDLRVPHTAPEGPETERRAGWAGPLCRRAELGSRARGTWEGKKSRDRRTGVDKPRAIRDRSVRLRNRATRAKSCGGAWLALPPLGGVPQGPPPSLAQLAQEHSDLVAPPSPRHVACPHVRRMQPWMTCSRTPWQLGLQGASLDSRTEP